MGRLQDESETHAAHNATMWGRMEHVEDLLKGYAEKQTRSEIVHNQMVAFKWDVEQHLRKDAGLANRISELEKFRDESTRESSQNDGVEKNDSAIDVGLAKRRMSDIENLLGESAEKYENDIATLHKELNARAADQAVLQERCDYFENVIHDSVQDLAKCEAIEKRIERIEGLLDESERFQSTLVVSQRDMEQRISQHAVLQKRLEHMEGCIEKLGDTPEKHGKWEAIAKRLESVEGSLDDSAAKYAKWETAHSSMATSHQDLEQRIAQHASTLALLERLAGDSAEKHAKWESSHERVVKLQEDCHRHATLLHRVEHVEDRIEKLSSFDNSGKWEASGSGFVLSPRM